MTPASHSFSQSTRLASKQVLGTESHWLGLSRGQLRRHPSMAAGFQEWTSQETGGRSWEFPKAWARKWIYVKHFCHLYSTGVVSEPRFKVRWQILTFSPNKCPRIWEWGEGLFSMPHIFFESVWALPGLSWHDMGLLNEWIHYQNELPPKSFPASM